ncbi:hypothetical protein [Noviherbaspirillum massiliense]|uniref:hypothetical protein n=1 Tax=Noviherbaspirillum massiliense TaxID=1465823 RepID=UPI0011DC93C4|nr:hypothetical protein [Noviherbaspirillum massiliense]
MRISIAAALLSLLLAGCAASSGSGATTSSSGDGGAASDVLGRGSYDEITRSRLCHDYSHELWCRP